ncbi:MAG: DNA gyrase subunit A [Rickettsiaceae bacterium H1]|nr:DNA gyrase subunit A [Rickettsiaceae bacterium H1]
MSDSIVPVLIQDELQNSYLSYAMSVIVSRAIPDVRDGLKPVHRRILYAMYESDCTWGKQFRKSARIVGEVMGKYHPHGDTAIYDSLARMAQDFSLYIPLIDGQGNFGSIDGDAPAAMRYTEVRLAKAASFMLIDLDKDTVDFKPNYDGLEFEPVVLPSIVPNLLLNGCNGVAVGMATNIPPHNLGELADACNLYIENNDVTLEELFRVIPGPDFPTGGTIVGYNGIRNAFATGKGTITIKGKTHIENIDQSKNVIVIDEIPYQVNKAKLIENIGQLIRDKKIDCISVKDESDRSGIRVAIELKRQTNPDIILNQLHKLTSLQITFSINIMALHNVKPSLMSLKDVICAFIDFRKEVVTRRVKFQLRKARERANILISLYISLLNIDEIISLIKSSKDNREATTKLLSKSWKIDEILGEFLSLISNLTVSLEEYKFNVEQVKAILDMKLHRLTNLEQEKLSVELNTNIEKIKNCIKILSSEQLLMKIIKEEISKVKDKFNVPRRTNIEEGEVDIDIEDLIEKDEMVVTVTEGGYIKRTKLSNYKSQRRGGKGKVAQSTADEDFTSKVFVANTHTNMLFFSNKGQVYKTKVYKLPLGEPQSRGRALVNIFPLTKGEVINNIMPYPEEDRDLGILFATANGKIRRNLLADFARIPSNGKIAIRLQEDDKLISVKVCDDNQHMLLATKMGKSIRFATRDIRIFKSRTSDGVRGIKLSQGDKVISMSILSGISITTDERDSYFKSNNQDLVDNEKHDYYSKNEQFILTVTENGFGKRSSAYEYRVTNRGGVGILNIITSKRNGGVVASFPVTEKDHVMLITDKGQLIRIAARDIRISGRNTKGVTLFRTKKGEKVVSVAKIEQVSPEEES